MTLTQKPRPVRDNNPGDIEYTGIVWQGLDNPPKDEKGYCRFMTPAWGFRALAVDLHTKWKRDGLTNIALIITKFAPPSENPTSAYIDAVCKMTGYAADRALNLDDENELTALCRAISNVEAGGWFFSPEDLSSGVRMALKYLDPVSFG